MGNSGGGGESLTRLMGKGEAQARRDLMELHGDTIEVDV
jgi:topoisomerase-4 subunit B